MNKADIEELLEALEDVVNQACYIPSGDIYDSMAISAYAFGMRVLAEHGILEIEEEHGRRVIAHRKERENE